MEGHQQDSESDIINKQRKKHIRKRTYNRMLTDAITHELQRLSGLDNSNVYSKYEEDYPMKNIHEVCINHVLYQNKIPRNIIVYVPQFKNVENEYLDTSSESNHEICYNNGSTNHIEKLTEITQYKGWTNSLEKYKKDRWCNCSGIDVSRLVIFAKLLYKTAPQLQNIKQKSTCQDAVPSNFFVMPVELENLRKLLNPAHRHVIDYKQNGNVRNNLNLTRANRAKDSIKFYVSIERYSVKFHLTLGKLNIFAYDFLQALQAFFAMPKKYNNGICNKVPCLIIRSWHFSNFIQGYLLSILLRNINVNSLNMMRKLYFVIITSSSVNLSVEIKIKLKSVIFLVYDNGIYKNIMNCSNCHKLIINKSVSMAALENLIQNSFSTRLKEHDLRLISYTKPQRSNPNIRGKDEYISKTESLEDFVRNEFLTDTESLQSAISDKSTVVLHRSPSSRFILGPEEAAPSEAYRPVAPQTCGSILSNILGNNHYIYSANFLHSKQWLMKLIPTKNNLRQIQFRDIISTFKYDTIKETIFDRTMTLNAHLECVTDILWTHVKSQAFYTVFFKTLSCSISNLFFSTVI